MSGKKEERPDHPRTGPEAPRVKRKVVKPDPDFTESDFDKALRKVAKKKPSQ